MLARDFCVDVGAGRNLTAQTAGLHRAMQKHFLGDLTG
jgi:hypothetical protein